MTTTKLMRSAVPEQRGTSQNLPQYQRPFDWCLATYFWCLILSLSLLYYSYHILGPCEFVSFFRIETDKALTEGKIFLFLGPSAGHLYVSPVSQIFLYSSSQICRSDERHTKQKANMQHSVLNDLLSSILQQGLA